jgi:phosphoesterase RecJ-like protein
MGGEGAKITIIPHVNPDGDAIGSAAGLANVLVNKGHNVTIVSPNAYPAYYDWFECKAGILLYDGAKNKAKRAISESSLLILLDFNDLKRAGKVADSIEQFNGPKILIDHHPEPKEFCDTVISDVAYSSTSELVFDVVSTLGFKMLVDKEAAECFYTGIMTDTGSFSHNNSNPNTYRVVAELIEAGVRADKVHSLVYHNFSAGRMRLLGYCLNEKMEIFEEYRTACISISLEEQKKYNFVPGDSEGFVNYPLSIAGVVFSALLIEKEDHIKCSFRSKGNFPANRFSGSHFGGGGHLNAAGGEIKLGLNETLELFKQLLPAYKHQLLNTEI